MNGFPYNSQAFLELPIFGAFDFSGLPSLLRDLIIAQFSSFPSLLLFLLLTIYHPFNFLVWGL